MKYDICESIRGRNRHRRYVPRGDETREKVSREKRGKSAREKRRDTGDIGFLPGATAAGEGRVGVAK